jgi:hypothetical protein
LSSGRVGVGEWVNIGLLDKLLDGTHTCATADVPFFLIKRDMRTVPRIVSSAAAERRVTVERD